MFPSGCTAVSISDFQCVLMLPFIVPLQKDYTCLPPPKLLFCFVNTPVTAHNQILQTEAFGPSSLHRQHIHPRPFPVTPHVYPATSTNPDTNGQFSMANPPKVYHCTLRGNLAWPIHISSISVDINRQNIPGPIPLICTSLDTERQFSMPNPPKAFIVKK